MKERQFLFCRISTGFPVIDFKTLSLLSPQSHFKGIALNNRNNQIFILCKSRPPQNKLFILPQNWVKTQRRRTILVLLLHHLAIWHQREENNNVQPAIFFFTNTTMFCDTAHFLYLMTQSAAFVFVASWEASFLLSVEIVLKCKAK